MNKQPVYYMQTDPRWKNADYPAPGESTTIGRAGCGPTCAAMLIETLTGKTYTPVDACQWSLKHGYKARNQGTYYAYFTPQFAEFGIEARQVNYTSLYGNPSSSIHQQFFDAVKDGYYGIACMGKGLWTSSGHFVVVWWEDGKVRINDPASTKDARLNGDLSTFKSQVKYYFLVDARKFNEEDEEDMDISKLTDDQIMQLFTRMSNVLGKLPPSDWSRDAREWAEAEGLIHGDENGDKQYQNFVTREQMCTFLKRFAEQ